MGATHSLDVESIRVDSFTTQPDEAPAPHQAPLLDDEALAATSRPVRPPYCTC